MRAPWVEKWTGDTGRRSKNLRAGVMGYGRADVAERGSGGRCRARRHLSSSCAASLVDTRANRTPVTLRMALTSRE